MKTAFDITVVFVTEDGAKPTIDELMGALVANKTQYYGDYAYSETRPIVYLMVKKEGLPDET